jgi:hypothetical protein
MLLVKCGQCGASYKLPEELYRRKAAGFGVVVTCRRCKAEIHVDAEPPTMRAEELTDNDAAPTAPTHERPEPPAMLEEDTPVPRTPAPALAMTPEPTVKLAPTAPIAPTAPTAPSATKPLAARPALPIPRAPGARNPAAATVKGIGVDAVKEASSRMTNERKAATPPAPRVEPRPKTAPKLVALSPGLLGTVTAPKPKPPVPPSPGVVSPAPPPAASPSPPAAVLPPVSPERAEAPPAPKPPRDPEERAWDPSVPPPPPEASAPDSEVAIASQDFLSLDSAPASELSVESKDFLADSVSSGALDEKEPDAPKKRLPEAPAARRGPKAGPISEELPSTTGTPKLDTLIHGTAVPLDHKKGDPPRKRQRSGDLSDDFMNADLNFDAPAIAPPTADALTRAPVSSRPAAAKSPIASGDGTGISSKSARPVSVKAEKKASSGRGWLALLLLGVLAAGGFAFRNRLGLNTTAAPEPPAAAPATSEPAMAEAPPAEPAAAPTEAAVPTPTPTTTVEAGAATPPEGAQGSTTAPPTGAVTATPRPRTPAPAAATPESTAPSTGTPAAQTPEPTATTPAAPIEPRPPVGTEPFDATAARAALDASAAQASSCRKPGDPSGVAVVIITFSPTGRVTTANISGPPFAATPTGGCIASTLRKTRVPAFAGDMVTVRKTVTIN